MSNPPEPGQTASSRPACKPWHKPQLERLGTVRDIAGNPPPLLQAAGSKFS